MKTIIYHRKANLFLVALLTILVGSCSSTRTATKPDVEEISNMVNTHRFTFVAERVNPMRGSSRPLTSYYDAEVRGDTLICYLPYFGRAYQAPIDPSKGGLDFTSHSFSYNITLKDKDEWQVYIEPKDIRMFSNCIFKFLATAQLH